MPLLNIVGSTNLNNTFFVACIFLGEESTEDYIWAMEALKSVLEQPGFTFPSIIVTDQELALINAVCLVFPSAKRVLCVWHVEKMFSLMHHHILEKEKRISRMSL